MRHVLLAAVTLLVSSSLASAGSESSDPSALVQAKLIRPLAAKDDGHSKFSRARLPPAERRVRIVDAKAQQDSTGASFYTFAVDSRRGWGVEKDETSWEKSSYTGCVYPSRGEVFIKRGNAFHPAQAAVGKKTKAAAASTCQAAAALSMR